MPDESNKTTTDLSQPVCRTSRIQFSSDTLGATNFEPLDFTASGVSGFVDCCKSRYGRQHLVTEQVNRVCVVVCTTRLECQDLVTELVRDISSLSLGWLGVLTFVYLAI